MYCGSSTGADPVFRRAAAELGEELAAAGHGLVYGGVHVGLMGVVADSVLAAGGTVTGVMTEHLVRAEVAHARLTRLEVVPTMHERKALMVALAQAAIVLPGGFGTLDETFEVLTWNQLGLVSSPVVFLDVDGYFGSLFDFVARSVDAGFVSPHHGAMAQRADSPAAAVALAAAPAAPFTPKWQR